METNIEIRSICRQMSQNSLKFSNPIKFIYSLFTFIYFICSIQSLMYAEELNARPVSQGQLFSK